jgi:hypothetical protein
MWLPSRLIALNVVLCVVLQRSDHFSAEAFLFNLKVTEMYVAFSSR